MKTTKDMKPEVLLGLDFICGNLDFILGGVSSYGRLFSRGCHDLIWGF